jgi:hypothetical protein
MVHLFLGDGDTVFTLDVLGTSNELLLVAGGSLGEVLRGFESLLVDNLGLGLKLSECEFLEMHEDLQRVGSVLGFLIRY